MKTPEPDSARLDALLRDPVVWDGPPPGLRGSLMEAVAAEAAELQAPHQQPAGARRGPRFAGWLVAAAVALLLAVGGGWLTRSDSADVVVALQGTPDAPTAIGTAEFTSTGAGMEITVQVEGLAAAAPGTYYAAWLVGPKGVVPVGSFHVRDGSQEPIELWSGVPLGDYPTLMVTLQQEGAPPVPSEAVVLRGTVEDS